MADEDVVAWGVTAARCVELARWCAAAHRSRWLAFADRQAHAWEAIVIALLEAGERPTREALRSAGLAAISDATAAAKAAAGALPSTRTGHRWAIWWRGARVLADAPFTGAVEERVALGQVWPCLPARDQETLTAAAAYESDAAAAYSLGLTPAAYRTRLSRARARARAVWAWPDPAAPHYSHAAPHAGPDSPSRRLARRLSARRARAAQQRDSS